MTAYDDALTISTILITVIIIPWVLFLFIPAFLQAPIGNSVTLRLLDAQGFHWIAAVAGAMIPLVLLIGAWLD